MSKRKKEPFEDLHYEITIVKRWNICQKIAKYLHRSSRTDENLEAQLKLLEQEFINNNK